MLPLPPNGLPREPPSPDGLTTAPACRPARRPLRATIAPVLVMLLALPALAIDISGIAPDECPDPGGPAGVVSRAMLCEQQDRTRLDDPIQPQALARARTRAGSYNTSLHPTLVTWARSQMSEEQYALIEALLFADVEVDLEFDRTIMSAPQQNLERALGAAISDAERAATDPEYIRKWAYSDAEIVAFSSERALLRSWCDGSRIPGGSDACFDGDGNLTEDGASSENRSRKLDAFLEELLDARIDRDRWLDLADPSYTGSASADSVSQTAFGIAANNAAFDTHTDSFPGQVDPDLPGLSRFGEGQYPSFLGPDGVFNTFDDLPCHDPVANRFVPEFGSFTPKACEPDERGLIELGIPLKDQSDFWGKKVNVIVDRDGLGPIDKVAYLQGDRFTDNRQGFHTTGTQLVMYGQFRDESMMAVGCFILTNQPTSAWDATTGTCTHPNPDIGVLDNLQVFNRGCGSQATPGFGGVNQGGHCVTLNFKGSIDVRGLHFNLIAPLGDAALRPEGAALEPTDLTDLELYAELGRRLPGRPRAPDGSLGFRPGAGPTGRRVDPDTGGPVNATGPLECGYRMEGGGSTTDPAFSAGPDGLLSSQSDNEIPSVGNCLLWEDPNTPTAPQFLKFPDEIAANSPVAQRLFHQLCTASFDEDEGSCPLDFYTNPDVFNLLSLAFSKGGPGAAGTRLFTGSQSIAVWRLHGISTSTTLAALRRASPEVYEATPSEVRNQNMTFTEIGPAGQVAELGFELPAGAEALIGCGPVWGTPCGDFDLASVDGNFSEAELSPQGQIVQTAALRALRLGTLGGAGGGIDLQNTDGSVWSQEFPLLKALRSDLSVGVRAGPGGPYFEAGVTTAGPATDSSVEPYPWELDAEELARGNVIWKVADQTQWDERCDPTVARHDPSNPTFAETATGSFYGGGNAYFEPEDIAGCQVIVPAWSPDNPGALVVLNDPTDATNPQNALQSGESCMRFITAFDPNPRAGCTALENLSANIARFDIARDIVGADGWFDPAETADEFLAMLSGDPNQFARADSISGPDGIFARNRDVFPDPLGEVDAQVSRDRNGPAGADYLYVVPDLFDPVVVADLKSEGFAFDDSGNLLDPVRFLEDYFDGSAPDRPDKFECPFQRCKVKVGEVDDIRSSGFPPETTPLVGVLPFSEEGTEPVDAEGNPIPSTGTYYWNMFDLGMHDPVKLGRLFNGETPFVNDIPIGVDAGGNRIFTGGFVGLLDRTFDDYFGTAGNPSRIDWDGDQNKVADLDEDGDGVWDGADDFTDGPGTDDAALCGTGLWGDYLQNAMQFEPYNLLELEKLKEAFAGRVPPRSPVFCPRQQRMLGMLREETPGRLDFVWHASACGDGSLDEGESCDDGGTESGDGCSTTCLLEDTWTLVGTAVGGHSITFQLNGVSLSIDTLAGQSSSEVAAAIAAAINGNPTLQDMDGTAVANGSTVLAAGSFSDLLIGDPGLLPGSPLFRWVYWVEKGLTRDVRRAGLGGENLEFLFSAGSTVRGGVALDAPSGLIYRTQSTGVVRSGFDGSGESVVEFLAGEGELAIDWTREWMYLNDANAGLFRVDLDGENLLQLDSGSSYGIALDVIGRGVYWASGDSIIRSEPDGSNRETVLFGPDQIRGVAVDTVGRKVYWTGLDSIYRADLDGANLETVTTAPADPLGIAVDPYGGKVYWADVGLDLISRVNLDGTDIETLYTAASSDSDPMGVALDLGCGDSAIHAPETCDDGNLVDGDGCSSLCQGESDTDGDGLFDPGESIYLTDPNVADSDNDGLTDGDEVFVYGTDPADPDSDDDLLLDGVEASLLGTDPLNPDSDGDTIPDGDEIFLYGTDPLNTDTDGDLLDDDLEINLFLTDPLVVDSDGNGTDDGDEDHDSDELTNAEELHVYGTDPLDPDTDDDEILDGWEVQLLFTDPLAFDSDGNGISDGAEDFDLDGLSNAEELNEHGTDPFNADTDSDLLLDFVEVAVLGTDPLVADSDLDGLSDGHEVFVSGTDPLLADTDGDGLNDAEEINVYGTDPLDADTDGDGVNDGEEVLLGSDPIPALPPVGKGALAVLLLTAASLGWRRLSATLPTSPHKPG